MKLHLTSRNVERFTEVMLLCCYKLCLQTIRQLVEITQNKQTEGRRFTLGGGALYVDVADTAVNSVINTVER